LAAAAGDLGGERVQVGGPERAELVQPCVHVAQRLRVDCVEPAGSLGAHRRKPRLAQDPEVLGHRGLGDPELGSDDLGERARRVLTGREQLENPSADGIAEDVERVHKRERITERLYKVYLARFDAQSTQRSMRNRRRRRLPPSMTVLTLDDASQGYTDFDSGVAKKFVLDPHGLIKA
jgi:hypothetical protein